MTRVMKRFWWRWCTGRKLQTDIFDIYTFSNFTEKILNFQKITNPTVDAQRPNHYRIPAARLALIDTSLAPPKYGRPHRAHSLACSGPGVIVTFFLAYHSILRNLLQSKLATTSFLRFTSIVQAPSSSLSATLPRVPPPDRSRGAQSRTQPHFGLLWPKQPFEPR